MSGVNNIVIDFSPLSPDEDDHCVKKPTTPFPGDATEEVRRERFQRITNLWAAYKWIDSVPHCLDTNGKVFKDEQSKELSRLWGRWFIPRNQLRKCSNFITKPSRVPDWTLDEVEQLVKRCFDAYDAVVQFLKKEGVEHNLKPREVRLEPLQSRKD